MISARAASLGCRRPHVQHVIPIAEGETKVAGAGSDMDRHQAPPAR